MTDVFKLTIENYNNCYRFKVVVAKCESLRNAMSPWRLDKYRKNVIHLNVCFMTAVSHWPPKVQVGVQGFLCLIYYEII